jgi:ribosomal protein L11 methyltransferase
VSFLLVLAAPPDELEILAAELFDLGATGVELQEPGQLLMPGTPPLPEGLGRCIGYFTTRETARAAAAELERAEAVPVEVPEQDWSVAWRAHHKPLRIGARVWVHPPWDVPLALANQVRVAIDPGMAFGTGSHPTTALCLERLDGSGRPLRTSSTWGREAGSWRSARCCSGRGGSAERRTIRSRWRRRGAGRS